MILCLYTIILSNTVTEKMLPVEHGQLPHEGEVVVEE